MLDDVDLERCKLAKSRAALDPFNGGRLNIRYQRTHWLAAFGPLLSDYLRSASSSGSEFIEQQLNRPDQGFDAFFYGTCLNTSIPRLKGAPEQAYYLCRRSPRLSMLLRILDLEGAFAAPRPRFLIVFHWPIVVWMVEMFVCRLGLRTVSVTASKSPEERAAAVAEFTSARSACQVLITTYNCGATGLNLHASCHVVILLESAPNFNLETQAIGRVHRVGQMHPQRAYRFFQDHTIGRYLHYNNFKKMMPQIAAQYRDVFEEEVENVAELNAEEADDDEDDDLDTKGRRIDSLCEAKLRSLMGLHPKFPEYLSMKDKKEIGVDGRHVSRREGIPGRAIRPPDPAPPATDAAATGDPTTRSCSTGKRKQASAGLSTAKRTKTAPKTGPNKVSQVTGQGSLPKIPKPALGPLVAKHAKHPRPPAQSVQPSAPAQPTAPAQSYSAQSQNSLGVCSQGFPRVRLPDWMGPVPIVEPNDDGMGESDVSSETSDESEEE